MVLIASFPFQQWASEMKSVFENMGIEAEVEAGGERAWQLYVPREAEEAVSILMENTGYLNCAR